jgi:polysaccharide export outer membrane protein
MLETSTKRLRAGGSVARLVAMATATMACAAPADFLWVDQAKIPPPPGVDYRITVGDVIGVRVWNQESMSMPRVRVREDGKISVPFLQDVEVDGMVPSELARRLETKLKTYVVNPVVTVTIEETRPVRVSVVGEVARAGIYEMQVGSGVLNALAAAGGLTDYAKRDGIYVLRQRYWADTSRPARIRFRYAALTSSNAAATFRLQDGDAVVVE